MRPERTRPDGFTLIELLIVVAVIGILAALLIPNLLDALQKSKQKRTVGDMRITGTALMSWLTDVASAAAAGGAATVSPFPTGFGSVVTADALRNILVSQYIQEIPVVDGWKTNYDYYLDLANVLRPNVMAIHSYGRDAIKETGPFTVTGFDPTDYDRDIIWTDGFFVRWPQKFTAPAAP